MPGCPGASLVGGKLFSEVLNIIAFPHDLVWIRKLLSGICYFSCKQFINPKYSFDERK